MKKTSPVDYYKAAVLVTYAERDAVSIISENGDIWDGQTDNAAHLRQFSKYGIRVIYMYDEDALLFLPESTDAVLTVCAEADTECCFAEIDANQVLTGKTEDFSIAAGQKTRIIITGQKITVSDEEKENIQSSAYSSINSQPVQTVPDDRQKLQEENQRLQKLVTQLYDTAYQDVYQQVENIEINAKMQELYMLKKQFESKKSSVDALENEKAEIAQKSSELETEKKTLLDDISAAEELLQKQTDEKKNQEMRLQNLCEELGMDVQTLHMYQNDCKIDDLLKKASELCQEITEVLQKRIQVRQQICKQRHDTIAGV